jgi:hypothetical protein
MAFWGRRRKFVEQLKEINQSIIIACHRCVGISFMVGERD